MLLTRQGAPSLIEDKRRTFTLWSKAPGVQHTAPKFCVCGQVQKDFRERDAPKRKRWTPNRTYTTTSAEARDSIYSLSLCPRPRRDIMLPRTKLIGSARRLLRRTPEYDVNESALAHRHADARRAGSWAPPTSRFATHARQDRGAPDPESTCVRHPPPTKGASGDAPARPLSQLVPTGPHPKTQAGALTHHWSCQDNAAHTWPMDLGIKRTPRALDRDGNCSDPHM